MPVQIRKGSALDVLNMTPLIDVVFLLLIFFLVATRFAQEDRELPVQLPSASSAMPMTMEPQELVVNVDEKGMYFVDGQTLDANGLETLLKTALTNNPLNQSVIIRGDRRVSLQYIVTVMDLCNKLGIANYKITTGRPEEN